MLACYGVPSSFALSSSRRKEGNTRNTRSIEVKRSWPALRSLPLAVSVASAEAKLRIRTGGMVVETEPALQSDRMPPPNSSQTVILDWPPLPDGRTWGATAGIDVGPDGHLWVKDRCGSNGIAGGCDVTEVDPILKLDRETGEVLTSVGAGRFITPHALAFDSRVRLFVADRGNHRIQYFRPGWEVHRCIQPVQSDRRSVHHAGRHAVRDRFDIERQQLSRLEHRYPDRPRVRGLRHAVRFAACERAGGSQGVAGEGVSVDGDGIVYGTEGPGSRPAAGSGITKYVKD